jgi:hypothetical protein
MSFLDEPFEEEPSGEGHVVRGRRGALFGVLGLLLVAAVTVAYGALGADPDPPPRATTTGPAGPTLRLGGPAVVVEGLTGRLVYAARSPTARGRDVLWVLDLATGSVEAGPVVPRGFELLAAGGSGDWVLILADARPGVRSYLLTEPTIGARPIELARSDVASLSRFGDELFVADFRGASEAACSGRYEVQVVALASGEASPVDEGPLPCGLLSDGALYGSGTPVVSSIRGRWPPAGFVLGPRGPEELFPVALDVWAAGRYVFASSRNDLVVWPGGGTPRPLLSDARAAGRPIASTADGRYLALGGAVDGQTGIWIIDVASGRVLIGAGSLPARSRVSDAAFADDGTLYMVGPSGISAAQPLGVRVVPLPIGAPEPRGQVVWLP